MKKTLLFVAVLFFVIIIGIVIFVSTLNFNKYKPDMEKAVYKATGYEVKINRDISFSMFPFGFDISSVEIKNPKSFYKKDIATADDIYIGLDIISLIKSNIKINSIIIDNPKIYLVKSGKGVLNVAQTSCKNSNDNKTTTGKSRNIFISKIHIKNAYVNYLDLSNRSRVYISNLNIMSSLKYFNNAKNFYNSIILHGKMDAECLNVNKKCLMSNIKADFGMDNGILNIKPVSYQVFDSDFSGFMKVDFVKNGLVNIEQKCEKLNLYRVSKAMYKNMELNGFISVNSYISFSALNKNPGAIETLNGALNMKGENIVLKGENLDKILEQYDKTRGLNIIDIGSFLVVGPLGVLSNKVYNSASLVSTLNRGKTEIKKLFVKIDIRNGIGNLSDVAFSTRKNRIAAKGKLDFKLQRYENVRVAVLNKRGCATIVQKIGGSFSNPKVYPGSIIKNTLIGKAMSLFGKIEESVGIKKTQCRIFYNGRVKQPK